MKPRTAEECLEEVEGLAVLATSCDKYDAADGYTAAALIIEAMIALHNKPRPGERKIELLPKDPE